MTRLRTETAKALTKKKHIHTRLRQVAIKSIGQRDQARSAVASVVVGRTLAGCRAQDVVDTEHHLCSLLGRHNNLRLDLKALRDAELLNISNLQARKEAGTRKKREETRERKGENKQGMDNCIRAGTQKATLNVHAWQVGTYAALLHVQAHGLVALGVGGTQLSDQLRRVKAAIVSNDCWQLLQRGSPWGSSWFGAMAVWDSAKPSSPWRLQFN